MSIAIRLPDILLGCYLLCLIALCFVAYLISAFYKKKFQKPVLQVGFLSGIVLFGLYLITLPFENAGNAVIEGLQAGLVASGSMAVGYNALRLYFIMRRPG